MITDKTKKNIELWAILIICSIGNVTIVPLVNIEIQYPFNDIAFFGLQFIVWFTMVKALIKYEKIG